MNYSYNEGTLTISINEDLDMRACKYLRAVIDGYIMRYQPKNFILDLSNVKFMDISGIGLIMGRYNLLKLMDSNMTIINPESSIKRIIELSNVSADIVMRSE